MFKHVKQPTSNSCGPAVVSIITGVPVADLIAELRPTPKGGTKHKKFIASLKTRGVACNDRFISVRGKQLPDTAVCRVTWSKTEGHFVFKHGRIWYDPLLDEPFTGTIPLARNGIAFPWTGDTGRITSFLLLEIP